MTHLKDGQFGYTQLNALVKFWNLKILLHSYYMDKVLHLIIVLPEQLSV